MKTFGFEQNVRRDNDDIVRCAIVLSDSQPNSIKIRMKWMDNKEGAKTRKPSQFFSFRYGFNDTKRLSDKSQFIWTLKSTLRQLSYHRHMREWNEGTKLQRGQTTRFYIFDFIWTNTTWDLFDAKPSLNVRFFSSRWFLISWVVLSKISIK